MSSEERMKQYFEKTLYENNVEQRDRINGMMKSRIESHSFENQTVTFRFPLMPWQANRAGFLQGGLVAVAFDITVSALARFYTDSQYIPTLSLDISYLKPIPLEEDLLVTAKVVSLGKRVSHYGLEGRSSKTGKQVASGTAVYLKADSTIKSSEKPNTGTLRQILNDSDRL
jgi:acyl-coenzyme A thioesterase PaaI-like protein